MSHFGDSNIIGPVTAFGEVSAVQNTPLIQLSAVYGLNDKMEAFESLGGTGEVNPPFFEATCGTTTNGFGAIGSRRQAAYRQGQGLLSRFSAMFDTGIADTSQIAGLVSNTDRLVFGYVGIVFGVQYQHNGVSDIRELTVTTPAGGAEDATVTVDGTAYTVPLTAGTVEHNAGEIAASLNAQAFLHDFSSNGDEVVCRSLLAEAGDTFAFSSATAIAAWATIATGAAPDNEFIPQTEWNENTMPGLDPTKGNVYQIKIAWLGFGSIRFYIEDEITSLLTLVHTLNIPNKEILPSLSNPTMRTSWAALNSGSGTSVTIKGSSAAAFIEGQVVRTESPRAIDAAATITTGAAQVNLLTMRNRLVFGTRRNRIETLIKHLSAATESTKTTVIRVYLNADIAGDLDYSYVDKTFSTTEFATDDGVVTGGTEVGTIILPSTGAISGQVQELIPFLEPEDTLTFAVEIASGAASLVSIGVIWQEDI